VKTSKQKILTRLNEPISGTNTELERETQKVQITKILRKKYTDKNLSFIIIFFFVINQSGRSFCASPNWRPQLRLGRQSLGSAQKYALLLFP
jgi:hypothetical protein